MASKAALMALVLIALVVVAAGRDERGHVVPLRRAKQSLGWMNGMKGGPPSGMQPSVTATTAHRRSMIGEEGKFIAPVPGFTRPPLPPTGA